MAVAITIPAVSLNPGLFFYHIWMPIAMKISLLAGIKFLKTFSGTINYWD
jgi:hypothetical protein